MTSLLTNPVVCVLGAMPCPVICCPIKLLGSMPPVTASFTAFAPETVPV